MFKSFAHPGTKHTPASPLSIFSGTQVSMFSTTQILEVKQHTHKKKVFYVTAFLTAKENKQIKLVYKLPVDSKYD